jgi:hypothetical protein
VERVSAQDRLRRAGGGRPGDPVRAIGGQVGEQLAAFLPELIEERDLKDRAGGGGHGLS